MNVFPGVSLQQYSIQWSTEAMFGGLMQSYVWAKSHDNAKQIIQEAYNVSVFSEFNSTLIPVPISGAHRELIR